MRVKRCPPQGDSAPSTGGSFRWKDRPPLQSPGSLREFQRSVPENADLAEETAAEEAGDCLSVVECRSCDLCRLLCPDLCVTRDEETGRIEIDYDFCKGCGICAAVCPRGAIRMVAEG